MASDVRVSKEEQLRRVVVSALAGAMEKGISDTDLTKFVASHAALRQAYELQLSSKPLLDGIKSVLQGVGAHLHNDGRWRLPAVAVPVVAPSNEGLRIDLSRLALQQRDKSASMARNDAASTSNAELSPPRHGEEAKSQRPRASLSVVTQLHAGALS
jgi:hypothetical protein